VFVRLRDTPLLAGFPTLNYATATLPISGSGLPTLLLDLVGAPAAAVAFGSARLLMSDDLIFKPAKCAAAFTEMDWRWELSLIDQLIELRRPIADAASTSGLRRIRRNGVFTGRSLAGIIGSKRDLGYSDTEYNRSLVPRFRAAPTSGGRLVYLRVHRPDDRAGHAATRLPRPGRALLGDLLWRARPARGFALYGAQRPMRRWWRTLLHEANEPHIADSRRLIHSTISRALARRRAFRLRTELLLPRRILRTLLGVTLCS
jgi:hypothetical protein